MVIKIGIDEDGCVCHWNEGAEVCLIPGDEPVVRVEDAPGNARRIFTGVDIRATVDEVWRVMTDYELLQQRVPNLVQNQVLERYRDGGARLRQVGRASWRVLGRDFFFQAMTVLDVHLHPEGLPQDKLAGADMDASTSAEVREYDRNLPLVRGVFPRPFSISVKDIPMRDISMENVEGMRGDFVHYRGVWRFQPLDSCGAPGEDMMRLTFSVECEPNWWLPVAPVESRIAVAMVENMSAIRTYVEENYSRRESKRPAGTLGGVGLAGVSNVLLADEAPDVLDAIDAPDATPMYSWGASEEEILDTVWRAVLEQHPEAPRNSGRVELLEDMQTGQLVAVKAMPSSWVCESHEAFIAAHPEENELPWRDISTTYYLSRVAGLTCICEFVGLFHRHSEQGLEVCMALSYCAGGDLFSWLERSLPATGAGREAAARPLMRRVLQAVRDIHAQGVAHGDLSLENVLLVGMEEMSPERAEIRVIDFGASTGGRAVGVRGKPSYQAPEVHSGFEYDAYAADVFSLGVMIFTLAVGNYPWRSTRPHVCPCYRFAADRGLPAYLARRKIRNASDEIVTLAALLSPHLISLLTGLLSVDSPTRLTVPAALEHPWFLEVPRNETG